MSQDRPAVSVIVPVYNVEPYLAECVESILAQTFVDFEAIIVDDGSTDGCPAICDGYAARDGRVRVIHKRNGGLSDARDAGIDAAEADLLAFVDSDDLIHPRMLETLVAPIADDADTDISVCAYRRFAEKSEVDLGSSAHAGAKTVPSERALEVIYDNHPANYGFVAWNKVYRKSLFDSTGIRYPVGRIHEDDFTTYKLLYAARSVALIDSPLYFYRMRKGSIMSGSKKANERSIDAIDARCEAYEFFRDKERPLSVASTKSLLRVCMQVWANSGSEGYGPTAKRIATETYSKTWKESSCLLDAEPKKKLAYGMFLHAPKLACRIFLGERSA